MASLEQLPSVTLLPLDVTSSPSIDAAVEAVKRETNGTLDYLINNAAINQYSPALDIDIAQAKKCSIPIIGVHSKSHKSLVPC